MKNNRYYTKCITAGRAAEGLRADWQEQLKIVQKEIGFEYIRFHGIFHDDMTIYDEDENGKPKFWFGYFDKLFDFLLSVGLRPIFELGFMPDKLKANNKTLFWWKAHICPPNDYDKWALLVSETVKHAVDRYGIDEVKKWRFEVWNEPNLGSFWYGTQEEYFKLYKYSVNAIKAIDKDLLVGGPSTSGADFREDLGYLKDFIKFCEKKNLPVDFFTAHPYPTYWPLDIDGNEQMGYMGKDVCCEFLDNIKNIVDSSKFKGAEIHLTEWNTSPSPRDLIHDTEFPASFILYNITQNFGKVDSLGFWTFTDIFEENGPGEQPFHGGFGLINQDGIKKPAYYAYKFLSELGDEIISIDNHKIVSKTDDDYILILWNCCYYKDEFAKGDRNKLTFTNRDEVFENKNEEIYVTIELSGKYTLETYTLDKETSALHNWVKIGAPQYPTVEQINALKNQSAPKFKSENITNPFSETYNLKPFEVVMLKLKKS